MTKNTNQLHTITQHIIKTDAALSELIPQAQALRDFFEQQGSFCPDDAADIGKGATRLSNGLAISPMLAAMCVRELYRTLIFIRGVHAAILDRTHTNNPVRVLYAGCGPYAALALPLMTAFASEQVRFTLLDIHQECLDNVQILIERFGLTHYVHDYICADATHYQIPSNNLPDIVVSETMAVCLRNEPQVSILRNLYRQVPTATLVPQSVSVTLCQLNQTKEHVLMPADYIGPFPEPERDRILLGKVFELDAENLNHWSLISENALPAAQIQLPPVLDKKYALYLLTHITVYGHHILQDYDCSLTYPQRLTQTISFAGGELLQFNYQLGNHPRLNFTITNKGEYNAN